jgi:hypothetical protein
MPRRGCHGRAGSKNDLRDGAEFRCGAAKAFYYISFRDKSAPGQRKVNGAPSVARLGTVGRCVAYLNERYEKRGCRTKWRFRNNLRYRRDTQWTAG